MAAAIESHRPALLRQLLERHVLYRDIFWMPVPRTFRHTVGTDARTNDSRDGEAAAGDGEGDVDAEVTCIGTALADAKCSHEAFDADLRMPIPAVAVSERILASLPTIARWHTSERFPADRILRDSGKFDFGEPQLYHLPQHSSDAGDYHVSRLHELRPGFVLHFELDRVSRSHSHCPSVCAARCRCPPRVHTRNAAIEQLNTVSTSVERITVHGSAVYGDGYWEVESFFDAPSFDVEHFYKSLVLKSLYPNLYVTHLVSVHSRDVPDPAF